MNIIELLKHCFFKISMWSSLRKPIKIVIYGNNAKEYPFIVKFGEDIRQDQRIQQLFSLSNSILLSDSSCQQRNLFLEQYQVISNYFRFERSGNRHYCNVSRKF